MDIGGVGPEFIVRVQDALTPCSPNSGSPRADGSSTATTNRTPSTPPLFARPSGYPKSSYSTPRAWDLTSRHEVPSSGGDPGRVGELTTERLQGLVGYDLDIEQEGLTTPVAKKQAWIGARRHMDEVQGHESLPRLRRDQQNNFYVPEFKNPPSMNELLGHPVVADRYRTPTKGPRIG